MRDYYVAALSARGSAEHFIFVPPVTSHPAILKADHLEKSLAATQKLPNGFFRSANLLLLAALYEEEGNVDQAQSLLHEATNYLYEREKAFQERNEKDQFDVPIHLRFSPAERLKMAPLACELLLKLKEPEAASRIATLMNHAELWHRLGKSVVQTVPASTIEKLLPNVPSPKDQAILCLGIVEEIAEELYIRPKADK